ncbi:MAG TPA: type I methionyl aminopeptidase [Myxococcales bacterium]|nr:type I methionyl aminopeptidase [Myxococcales bacterium]
MRITRLRPAEIDHMRRAGRVAAETLSRVGQWLEPGVRTSEIDAWVRADTARQGARPSQLGYHGFPAAVCTSRNDVACHGIPREDEVLEDGDLVSVDVTSQLDGWHGDTCATFAVGTPSPEAAHLLETARRCRDEGIAQVRAGVRLGDVGAVIEAVARRAGCGVVRVVGGHGIGRRMHQPPHVDHFGSPGRGIRLKAGMAITIEPILTLGAPDLVTDADGWTMRTLDGSWAAQFEHTIVVEEDGAQITTLAVEPRVR